MSNTNWRTEILQAVLKNIDDSTAISQLGEAFFSDVKKSGFSSFVDDPTSASTRSNDRMAQPKTMTTESWNLFDCPACGVPVTGRVVVELHLNAEQPDDNSGTVHYTGKTVGVKVNHDCTPRLTRD